MHGFALQGGDTHTSFAVFFAAKPNRAAVMLFAEQHPCCKACKSSATARHYTPGHTVVRCRCSGTVDVRVVCFGGVLHQTSFVIGPVPGL